MFCKKVEFRDISNLIEDIGVDAYGKNKINLKSELYYFYITKMSVIGANILKQEALSIGAEVALPKGAITHENKLVDAVIIISHYNLSTLCKKLEVQQFGLNILSKQLSNFLNNKKFKFKIMGIVNITDDSFYSGSRFDCSNAIKKIENMINDGASIVDLGGCSSRPYSEYVDEDLELTRVKPIIEIIGKQKLYEKATFSIDSFRPKVVKMALDNGFSIINDITGFNDDELCKLCASYDATALVMHMQNSPKNMQIEPKYNCVVKEIDEFFTRQLIKLESFGVKNAYLDVGVGFGKLLEHNLELISSLSHFCKFNKEIVVGLSRKGFIDKIVRSKVEDRLPATISLNIRAVENGANIIRVHDVKEHYQAFKVYNSF